MSNPIPAPPMSPLELARTLMDDGQTDRAAAAAIVALAEDSRIKTVALVYKTVRPQGDVGMRLRAEMLAAVDPETRAGL